MEHNARSLILTPLDEPFEKHLIEYRCFPHDFVHRGGQGVARPRNWEELQQLISSRQRIQTTNIESQDYNSETTLASQLASIQASRRRPKAFFLYAPGILEGTDDTDLATGVHFEQLKPLTDGSLIAAEPGFYRGANISQLSPPVCEALKSYIVPSYDKTPILPNFFVEAWPGFSHYRVGIRQSLYIGCMGARAMQALQSYDKPDLIFDGNAYTIVATYYDDVLELYSLHPTKPVESRSPIQYHMTRLASFAIRSVETLRVAVTAYRNLRHWTKEKRDEFIAAANERVILTFSLMLIKTSAEAKVSIYSRLISATGH